MPTLALHLDDAGLLLAASSGLVVPPSPGVALLEGGTLFTGRAAAARRRLAPRLAHDRFWHDLDTTPLGRPFPDGLSAADLAHAHLRDLWTEAASSAAAAPDTGLLVAAPGAVTPRQLAVLLGVARAAGIRVAGLVDAAVAVAARPASLRAAPDARHLVHVELHRHRVVLTTIATTDTHLIRTGVATVDVGQAELESAWARRLAQAFLRQTRFDPLHHGASEQQLYERLPEWLHQLELDDDDQGVARLEHRGNLVTAEVDLDPLLAAVEAPYRRLLEAVERAVPAGAAEEPVLLLGDRIAALPSFRSRVESIWPGPVHALTPTAATVGALAARDVVAAPPDTETRPFVTRLPRPGAEPAPAEPVAAPPPAPRQRATATHVVLQGVAHRLPQGPLQLGTALPAASPGLALPDLPGVTALHATLELTPAGVTLVPHAPTTLAGHPVEARRPAAPGERFRLGDPELGAEIELIRLEDG